MDRSEALQETILLLKAISGGAAVIEWFDGRPKFGDAEVLELRLARRGPSLLRISAKVRDTEKERGPSFKHAVFDFALRDMIDVRLDGFSHQNVIGGLTLCRAQDRPVHPSLRGIGTGRSKVEIELAPCAGAHGTIRCTIEQITITPVEDYQNAEAGPLERISLR